MRFLYEEEEDTLALTIIHGNTHSLNQQSSTYVRTELEMVFRSSWLSSSEGDVCLSNIHDTCDVLGNVKIYLISYEPALFTLLDALKYYTLEGVMSMS